MSLLLREILGLIKVLNKKFFILVVVVNSAYEGAVKVSELVRVQGEQVSVGVDKVVYCQKVDGAVNYVVVQS